MNGTPAWTRKGQPLAYMPLRPGQAADIAMRAAIAVENIQGPVLTISGESDHVWHSSQMADDVIGRLKHNHFAYFCENLKYPHAGHAAGRPAIQPAWHGITRHPVSGREMDTGGSAQGDAASSLDAIPKVLSFLQKSLQERPSER